MIHSTTSQSRKINIIWQVAAVVLALALWEIIALTVNLSVLIPTPVRVLVCLKDMIFERSFWNTVVYSMSHIMKGFFIAFGLGVVLAILSNLIPPVEFLLMPYVMISKTVPVASFIIISLIWLSGDSLSTFISFLMVFPFIYTNVSQGIKATDKQMLEMARVYNMPWWKRLVYIHLQSVKPHLLAGCNVALGTAWKAGVAAEVIGLVNGSIGSRLYEAKIFFMSEELFAWTITICLVSVLVEKVFIALLKLCFKGLERL